MLSFPLHALISLGCCVPVFSAPLGNDTYAAQLSGKTDPCDETVSPPGCPVMPTSTIPTIPDQIPDKYIVTLNETADMSLHIQNLKNFIAANRNCTKLNNNITLQFNQPSFKFYSGYFDGRVLAFISKSTDLVGIGRDQILTIDDPDPPTALSVPTQNVTVKTAQRINRRTRTGAPWNLARITRDGAVVPGGIDQGTSVDSRDWTYWLKDNANGKDVALYVIDTGVDVSHQEFGGRAFTGPEFVAPGLGQADDVFGHGTSVAAVAAGATVGVANQVTIFAVKASNTRSVNRENIVWALGTATEHYTSVRGGKGGAVINISIGTSYYDEQDGAIYTAIKKGIHVVTSAGNEKKDMTGQWSDGLGAINVGASDINDNIAYFSNYGQCVDVYAPGHVIATAGTGNNAYVFKSGTSFAAPIVSGMIASIIVTSGDLSPEDMRQKIIDQANTDHLTNIASFPNSNNRLATFGSSLRTQPPLVDAS